MLHLTHTGFYAGRPICGAERSPEDRHIHAVYAPLDNAELRGQVCPDCLKVWTNSYDDDEPAPDWVRAMKAAA